MTNEKTNILAESYIFDLSEKEKIAETIGKLQQACLAANPPVDLVDASGIIQTDENGDVILNLGDENTHRLQIFPISDGRGEQSHIVYSVMAITPKFDRVLESDLGMNFLKQAYDNVVTKKIRDNVRNAYANKRVYTAPRSVEDFLSTSRAVTGSEAFKKIVADLVKGLREKFKKYPSANAVITQKTLIEAFKCEALAKQVFSFMIDKTTGDTILGKILEGVKAKLANAGEPTNVVDEMLATRMQTEIAEEEDTNDLLDVDSLLA